MVPAQAWRSDAVMRLLISVFICIYTGSLVGMAVRYGVLGKSSRVFWCVFAAAVVCMAVALVLTQLRWELHNFVRRAAGGMIAFYVGIMLGAWAHKLASLPEAHSVGLMLLAGLSFQGATVILIGLFIREHGMKWSAAFGFRERWLAALLVGVTAACLFLPLGSGLKWLSSEILVRLPGSFFKPEDQQAVQTLRMAEALGDRAVLAALTIFLAPAGEELLFRGVLYTWVKQLGFPRLALWGTAFLFAAAHFNAGSFIPLMLFAILLAILYERTGNLLASMAAHGSFNAMNFLMQQVLERHIR